MRRARLKYQPRIYALDLRFNNATENQYLIKQMMEKNTAREMRLLHCFQTSQSQRRLSWQNGLETRLTRESGMQTIACPIDSYSVISGLVGHFYWRTNIKLQWDQYEVPNRAGANGLSQPSIGNPVLSWPIQDGLQSSPSVLRMRGGGWA